LLDNEIYNIFEDCGGQISNDSEVEAKLVSIDNGSSHVDGITLGEVTVSEIDVEEEDESNKDFLWENMSNYAEKKRSLL
jgi:hypothetical protein